MLLLVPISNNWQSYFVKSCRLQTIDINVIFSDTNPQLDMNRGLCIRRTLWEDTAQKCHGVMKNYNCNLALADLNEVFQKRCLFINKFSVNVDGTVISCLHYHLTHQIKNG